MARARVQSITIDEADTFLDFVNNSSPLHWFPAANNHVLNSMLIRLATTIFGVSHFVVRLPALLGAAIYITCVIRISVNFGPHFVRCCGIACLLLNPFIQDHLVAARGYSLAMAFLAVVAVCLLEMFQDSSGIAASRMRWRLALLSSAAGLTVCANFSFALVAASLLLSSVTGLILLYREEAGLQGLRFAIRSVSLGIGCGALFVYLLCGSVISQWPAGQLSYGASSLRESLGSLFDDTLYTPSAFLLNPDVWAFVALYGRPVMTLSMLISCCAIVGCFYRGRATRLSARQRWMAVCLVSLCSAFSVHYAAFRTIGLRLPFHRTGLYVVVLYTMVLCCVEAGEPEIRRMVVQWAKTVTLCVSALYFLSCERLTFFKEWEYNSDGERVYAVVKRFSQRSGESTVYSQWRYRSVMKFCAAQEDHEAISAILDAPKSDTRIFVLYFPEDKALITGMKLEVLYHNEQTGGVVAVDPRSSRGTRRE